MKRIYKIILAICSFIAFGILLEIGTIYFCNKNLHQILYPESYKLKFPQERFSVRRSKRADYRSKVAAGYKKMKTKRAVFAGLGRNIEQALPANIDRIENAGKLFGDYRVVIFENDSEDRTREMLKEWAKRNNKVRLVECPDVKDCKFGNKRMYDYGVLSKTRMEKMADFRNKYLNEIEANFADFDYTLILDIDLQGPLSHDGIAHSVAQKDWDGIFAYGLHSLPGTFGSVFMMYDGLAFVGEHDSNDCSKHVVSNYFRMNFRDLWSAQPGDKLVPVKSSFSGLAIYKTKSLLGSHYNANWPCEHIGLHEQMKQKGHGKFYINPSLLLLSGHQGSQNIFNYF